MLLSALPSVILWSLLLVKSSLVPSPPCSSAPVPQRVVAFCPSVLWQRTGADQRWRGLRPPRWWLQHHGVRFTTGKEHWQQTYQCWIDGNCCKSLYLGLAFRESSNLSECKSPETKPASKIVVEACNNLECWKKNEPPPETFIIDYLASLQAEEQTQTVCCHAYMITHIKPIQACPYRFQLIPTKHRTPAVRLTATDMCCVVEGSVSVRLVHFPTPFWPPNAKLNQTALVVTLSHYLLCVW